MVAWHPGLFDNDDAVALVYAWQEKLGVKLQGMHPEKRGNARRALSRQIPSLIPEFSAAGYDPYSIIIFTALAMENGADLGPLLRGIAKKAAVACTHPDYSPLARHEMLEALEHYPNNGTAYMFGSKGVYDVMEEQEQIDDDR